MLNKDGKPPALAGYPAKLSHLKTIPAKKKSFRPKNVTPVVPKKKKKEKVNFALAKMREPRAILSYKM